MHIVNKSARLIDFSWDKKKYRLMPAGKSVEVPDAAAKSTFLKALIDDGSVAKVANELTKEEKAAIKLESLQEEAKSLGIEFDDSWNAKDLTAEIKKKK